jgi:hypothetical protein
LVKGTGGAGERGKQSSTKHDMHIHITKMNTPSDSDCTTKQEGLIINQSRQSEGMSTSETAFFVITDIVGLVG